MDQEERRLFCIQALLREMPQYRGVAIPGDADGQRQLLRSLMNVRPPMPASAAFLEAQDAYLQERTREKGIVDADALPATSLDPRLVLWQGDITTLACDAIVNAANSQLLGCFSPCHGCIDNIIHTMSGVQLRLKCDELMRAQGHEEPTGRAKLTPGYNLPARFVLHTVGPIVAGALTAADEAQLADCYRSCLALAAAHGLVSVAFCCISTGVFRFPQRRAAEIAVETVRACLDAGGTVKRVIFNVFKDSDLKIYRALLERPAE